MIKPWDPWWTHPLAHYLSLTKSGTQLVQSLEEQSSKETTGLEEDLLSNSGDESLSAGSDIPAPPDIPLQAVRDLTSKQPSPLLGVHLTEAVYGYCFTLRLFNGDWESDPLDAALVLLGIAKVLGDGASPESVGAALAECLENVCSPSFKHAGGYRLVVTYFPLFLALFFSPEAMCWDWFTSLGFYITRFGSSTPGLCSQHLVFTYFIF